MEQLDSRKMAPSLFENLPRELREQVYAHVLTAPQGLAFRKGKGGVSRICECQVNNDSSGPSSQYLVSRYIHNIISACVSSLVHLDHYSSFNQIQYVSRLLYQEAHGLELRYNTVFFRDSNGLTAQQGCRQVINKVATWRYAQNFNASISSSQLSFGTTVDAKGPLTLVGFCRLFPKAIIKLHSPLWSQTEPGFVLFGISYSAVVRRHNAALDSLMQKLGEPLDSTMAFPESFVPSGVPDNFRLFPHEEQLDRAVLRTACSQSLVLQGDDSSLWVELAEVWFKNGI